VVYRGFNMDLHNRTRIGIFKNRNSHTMVEQALEIKPTEGLGPIRFGVTANVIKELLGEPEEVEMLDEAEGMETLVWHYWQKGFSIFFDEKTKTIFSCVEIDNSKSQLWGQCIFEMHEKEIEELFKSKGYFKSDEEVHEWGEKRISYDDIQVDLYFSNNKLNSVNYGVVSDEFKFTIWPN
jgi:hypothetical protein